MSDNCAAKVVLVLGGAGGIGSAAARGLALRRAKVAVADIDSERAEALATEIASEGAEARGYSVDVIDAEQVVSLAGKVIADFGRIDVVINSVGVMYIRPISEIHTKEWNQTIDLNIKGTLWGVAAVLPTFLAQRSGHIINLGSVHGLKVFAPGGVVHSASKFAIRAFSEGLRSELAGTGIRVTTITPGATDTGMEHKTTSSDSERMKAIYSQAIPATAVADAIIYAISQPDEIAINDLIIRPATQVI